MSLFESYTLTVNRYNGSYISGKWNKIFDYDFQIKTSWQPIAGEDIETLPEGKRAEFTFRGYPNTQLRISDPKKGVPADVIIGPDGYQYEVIKVKSWNNNLINHYKFIATRIKEGN